MLYAPEDVFWVLEYDARMTDGWEARYRQVMNELPDDWDVLFLGSCCARDKPTKRVSDNIYEVRYPMCGHALMYRKKALPVLLQEHQKLWAPLDIALMHGAFPKLRVYTVLPPLVVQHGTPLPP